MPLCLGIVMQRLPEGTRKDWCSWEERSKPQGLGDALSQARKTMLEEQHLYSMPQYLGRSSPVNDNDDNGETSPSQERWERVRLGSQVERTVL